MAAPPPYLGPVPSQWVNQARPGEEDVQVYIYIYIRICIAAYPEVTSLPVIDRSYMFGPADMTLIFAICVCLFTCIDIPILYPVSSVIIPIYPSNLVTQDTCLHSPDVILNLGRVLLTHSLTTVHLHFLSLTYLSSGPCPAVVCQ